MPAQVLVELPTEKGDVELEAKHGDSEMIGQGRASGFTGAFKLPAGEDLGGDNGKEQDGNELQVEGSHGRGNRRE
jgi:hypothetical protein